MSATDPTPAPRVPGLELLAGWVVPGLGHYLIGQRRRGLIVGLTISAVWVLGLLISGLGAVDYRRHTLWFFGQVMVGPTLAVELANRQVVDMLARPGQRPRAGTLGIEPAYGRADEQGVLYTTLAGLLNLLVLVDLATGDQRRPAAAAGSRMVAGSASPPGSAPDSATHVTVGPSTGVKP